MNRPLDIVIFGLSVTSSWGNGHATTYRALMRGLHARGHRVTFLERNMPWYAQNRDLPKIPYGRLHMYSSLQKAKQRFQKLVANADLVIVGSYVPEGSAIGQWVIDKAKGFTAFYDIDTPVTVAALEGGKCDYVSVKLIERYDLYLSFTGGPTLQKVQRRFGARNVEPLYCSADPEMHSPETRAVRWDLGYIGTYSEDRQVGMEELMLRPARQLKDARMVVAGPQYPASISWPSNVERIEHLAPGKHRGFYSSQRFTLNLTRDQMRRVGYSPSVRLFEAAACGTPIITDSWPGLESLFNPGKEILITRSSGETVEYLQDFPDKDRVGLGARARERVLREHTAMHRAMELESHVQALRGSRLGSVAAQESNAPAIQTVSLQEGD